LLLAQQFQEGFFVPFYKPVIAGRKRPELLFGGNVENTGGGTLL
jgi:hypothetical protein